MPPSAVAPLVRAVAAQAQAAAGEPPAAGHLGAWEGPSAINFGKDGRPFYMSGPYDSPRQIMKTQQRTVGPSANVDYFIGQAG